jgi:iron complex transport system permease protein
VRWARAGSLVVLLVAAIVVSTALGAVTIAPADLVAILLAKVGIAGGAVDERAASVLMGIRLPRVITGALVGGLLAVAGTLMQARYRSPLADPVLVGMGGAAALGAVAGTVILLVAGAGSAAVASPILPGGELAGTLLPAALAIAGAAGAFVVVGAVAAGMGRATVATMLLAGIALDALFTSLTGIMTLAIHDPRLRDTGFWTLGGLSGATWRSAIVAAVAIGLAIVAAWRLGPGLDALALGDEEAGHLGVDVRRHARGVTAIVALATGAAVAVAGPVAFVALLAPTAARHLLGSGTRLTLVGAIPIGATFLLIADLAARSIASPSELPVGLVTAAIGAPAFLWLLRRFRTGVIP